MTENLPDWAVVDAEVVFVTSPSGMGRDTLKKAVITKITPSGQIVTTASDLRLKPRDYEAKRDRFYRYRSEGRMSFGSISLYPRNHPEVPKMLAVAERDEAWTEVSRRMYELERRGSATPEKSRVLRAALESWERAVIRAEDA
jgi:hypothetical protein